MVEYIGWNYPTTAKGQCKGAKVAKDGNLSAKQETKNCFRRPLRLRVRNEGTKEPALKKPCVQHCSCVGSGADLTLNFLKKFGMFRELRSFCSRIWATSIFIEKWHHIQVIFLYLDGIHCHQKTKNTNQWNICLGCTFKW